MRTLFFFLSLLTFSAFAQEEKAAKAFNKGKLYVYWGWNREWFTHSNITFIGENYQFTLYDVVAHDRQSPFNLLTYFNPLKLSIPQYNFRTGYFFAEHWDISFGQDHMKYVMQQNQQVKITGNIANSNTEYDGQYNNENILLSREFLAFEHTDGLNYVNLELRRNDVLFRYKKVRLNLIEGIGFGALVPRTNTLLMNKLVMLCVGSATQDVFLGGKVFTPECEDEVCYEHLKLGDKLTVDNLTYATGGNAMNAAVTFARQDLETHFIGLLGDDPAAQAVLAELDKESIQTNGIVSSSKYTTSYSVVLLAPSGERTILNYHGEPLSSQPGLVSEEKIKGDWLYVSSVGSMSLLHQIMERAKKNNVKIAFNPASFELKHIQASAQLLQYVDLFAVNKEEASLFVEGDSALELAKKLAESCQYVLVSDGPKGAVATDGLTIVEAGMYDDVPVIDRLGAGDAFASGFTAIIAKGGSLEEALTFASANSTSVVSKIGAKAGILRSPVDLHDMPLKSSSI